MVLNFNLTDATGRQVSNLHIPVPERVWAMASSEQIAAYIGQYLESLVDEGFAQQFGGNQVGGQEGIHGPA
jgi:hypothetical protein